MRNGGLDLSDKEKVFLFPDSSSKTPSEHVLKGSKNFSKTPWNF